MKFSSDRTFAEAHGIKLGAFGTNQKRFENVVFEKNKNVPGPGHYDKNENKLEINLQQSKISAKEENDRPNTQSVVFKSTTDRFVKVDN